MADTNRKIDIKNRLLTSKKILGNSNVGFKEVCSDLLNAHGRDKVSVIMNGTHLSYTTIERMMTLAETEGGRPYNPSNDTIERILRFYGAELSADQVVIKSRYLNKPKQDGKE